MVHHTRHYTYFVNIMPVPGSCWAEHDTTGRNIYMWYVVSYDTTVGTVHHLSSCQEHFRVARPRRSVVSLSRSCRSTKSHFESSQHWLKVRPSETFIRNLTAKNLRPRGMTCFDQANKQPNFDTFLLLHISPTREWLFSHLPLKAYIQHHHHSS